jgi:hypothetical protein
MFTFGDQLDLVKEETGIDDAASITRFKRDINRGGSRFLATLGREYTRQSRTTDLRANKQYYQYPEDALRISDAISSSGGIPLPLTLVADEDAWRYMNSTPQTGQPTHFFVRGFDEIGIYPMPAATVENGLEIVYEPRSAYMRASDTTGSTASVTNGTVLITSTATPFTANMVGYGFEVTDETDTNWYRIAAYTNGASINLENYYQGTTGAGKSFRIGQVMYLPEEFLEAPAYWAVYRHWKRRGNSGKANEALAEFTAMRDEAKELYGQQTSSQVIMASEEIVNRPFNSFRGDAIPSTTTS